ncbi:uncharacterized protein LOC110964191 isoform X2 [Acanthochromis polyacanthus]|uniref:uncharacterized protein LOC110964191 isoform X2 n=1 Tax=Acanthochromis polyacanthus TaxID=80966 RepID=UPI0022349F1A|nr:uncharacterized protein LOC110964191 isoform X2 [Acanthochromis polyacanthus]XP_051799583.1 uncharacterized protein LOC110964191 isoform X2 [Acanthochromis polyacanthus]
MDYGLVIFVLTGALVSVSFAQTRQYFFVSTPLNWTNAQSICRRNYTDLATIESTAGIVDVSNTTSNYTGKAWIGLYDDLENSWRWSFNDSSFYGAGEETYRNWLSSEPNNLGGQQYCVVLLSPTPHFGLWSDVDCNSTREFVCYNGTVNGTASFVLVETPLNWTDAQIFCRTNYVDLASIRNSSENAVVTSTARGNFVWIGLYRQKVWSDGSNSLFRHWADHQPDSGGERCVTAQFNNSGRWSDENCSLSFPFVCFTTIPPNAEGFTTTGQNETSIVLQANVSISILVSGGTNFTAPLVITLPPNTDSFRSTGQNETSITLQWNQVNNNVSYILLFNGSETNFSAPAGDGPINHTVSSLTAGTQYTFTLFSVIATVRSSGVSITAVTAPSNTDSFRSTGQNGTSITLQWNKVNNNVSYILQFNGSETNFSAAAGDGPINHTVSSLFPATYYTFTLFSVFENVRSSGVNITVITGALVSVSFAQTRQYFFVSTPLNWTNAQGFCRRNYTDLATIESTADIVDVSNTTSNYTGKAWIGLYDDLENSWRWSFNDSSFYGAGEETYRNWLSSEPNNLGGQQYCVVLLSPTPHFGLWSDVDCNSTREFVCYNGTVNGTASFVLVETPLNWTDAQIFCRTNYVDLASIRNSSENAVVTSTARGNFVWIGLYRQKVWSDGSSSLFRHWADHQPDSGGERCVTAQFNNSGRWSDENCSLSLPFVCFTTIPPNAEGFTTTGQNETSITLQWNQVNENVSYILLFNGSETNVSAAAGDGPINHTVSSLTAGTQYTFTLFSVIANVRSSGVNITAVTVPSNANGFRSTQQNETSITLQWNRVNNNVSYILLFNGSETFVIGRNGLGPINYIVSSLTAGTKYTFTLFSVFENVRSSGVNITAVTAPSNTDSFRSTGRNETSITLQWNQVNNNVSYILLFNGSETNFSAAAGDGPINHTVSSLSPATLYIFTLFSVFENVRSSGVSIFALTDPSNPNGFRSTGQNETSINLQWNQVNNVAYILQLNGSEIHFSAPTVSDGPINHTVSSLTAGTEYTFTLFSVFLTSEAVGSTSLQSLLLRMQNASDQ